MGSWDEYCAISKLGIRIGDRAVAIFLKEGKYDGYHFASLPIKGTYGDYGRMEELDNPEWLIGVDFEEPADCEIIWFHEEIYDYYTSNILSEYNEKGPFENNSLVEYPKSEILELLGFVLLEDTKFDDRYKLTYQHPDNDKIFIGSDGTWMRVFDGGRPFKPEQYIYSTKAFVEFWEKTTNIKLNIDPILEFPKWYFSISEELKNNEDMMEIYAAYNRENPDKPPLGKDRFDGVYFNASHWSMDTDLYRKFNSYEVVARDTFIKEIAKMNALKCNAALTNISIVPNVRGVQYTEPDNIQTLLNVTQKLLDRIKADEEERAKEDEDFD
jgi:hypothetical protein